MGSSGNDGLICGHRRLGVQIRMSGGLKAVDENPALEKRGN
jgi:hypothetical protein